MLCISTLPVNAVRQGQVENTLEVHSKILATPNQPIMKQCLRLRITSLIALNQY